MRVILVTVVMAALVSACFGGAGTDERPLELSTTVDLGDGFSIGLPDGWELREQFGEPSDRTDDCVVRESRVGSDTDTMQIILVGAACSSDTDGRGNGESANFSSADQLVGGEDLETLATDLGPLTVATVGYYECTNECQDWTPSVGVIELAEPTDPAYPALMIINDYGSTRNQVRFLAQNLTRS